MEKRKDARWSSKSALICKREMRTKAFWILKSAQVVLILAILWQSFSFCTICGTFIRTKEVLRHGIDGTCRRLFFYLPPNNAADGHSTAAAGRLPNLRRWWIYEGPEFLPPIPGEQELGEMSEEIKSEYSTRGNPMNWTENVENVTNEKQQRVERGLPDFMNMQKPVILPDEESKPMESVEMGEQEKDRNNNSTGEGQSQWQFKWDDELTMLARDRANKSSNESIYIPARGPVVWNTPEKRAKRESNEVQTSPWPTAQEGKLLLKDEDELKKSISLQQMVEMSQQLKQKLWKSQFTVNEEYLNESQVHCFELNLQEFAADMQNLGWSSPLVKLGNRSMATVAVAFSHLLLLFSQVYLLNCLEVDNLEQKRGKMFLELFVVLLGVFGWLAIVLMKVRMELGWELTWLCTNFRPFLITKLVVVQVLASAVLVLSLIESVYIYTKLRKCHKMIETEKEKDLKPMRPKI